MYVSKIYFSELEDRIDAKYYDPKVLQILERVRKKKNLKIVRLGDICTKIRKGIFYIRAFEYRRKGVPFIRVSDVKNLAVKVDDLVFISEERNKKESKTCMKVGDLLVTKGGTVGVVTFVPSWIKRCNISQDIIGLSIKKNIDPWYVATFLSSRFGRLQFERIKTQQAQPHLTLENVKRLRVVLPQKDVQLKVSRIIKEADKREAKALELIERAKKIVYESVGIETKKIEEEKNYSVVSSELGDLLTPKFYYPSYVKTVKAMEKKFQTILLGEISEIKRGKEVGSRNYIPYINKRDEDIPFIRTSDIANYEIDNYPDFYVSKRIYESLNQDIKEGDILFTNDGKIGFSAMVVSGDNCVIQSHIRRIRVLRKLSPQYVFALLNTDFILYQVYQRIYIQATISTIGNGLRNVKIPLLPEATQEKISTLVSNAFNLKEEKKTLIKEARSLVQNLAE
jgi:type I restriction enzyme S subunit